MPLLRASIYEKVLNVSVLSIWQSLNPPPGRAEERVAKLVDSPDRPESEASYKLDEGGWSDV